MTATDVIQVSFLRTNQKSSASFGGKKILNTGHVFVTQADDCREQCIHA